MTRGGAKTDAVVALGEGARVLGSDPATPELLMAPQQVIHPVAAPATPEGGIKALT